MGTAHLHAPAATAKKADAETCPDCNKRTRMLSFFTPWYGWNSVCLRCGREWQDGQWMPLPFIRGVRQKNVEQAKKRWRAMPPQSKNHYGVY